MDTFFKCYLEIPDKQVKTELDVIIQVVAGGIGALITAAFGIASIVVIGAGSVYGVLCASTVLCA